MLGSQSTFLEDTQLFAGLRFPETDMGAATAGDQLAIGRNRHVEKVLIGGLIRGRELADFFLFFDVPESNLITAGHHAFAIAGKGDSVAVTVLREIFADLFPAFHVPKAEDV